MIIKLNAAYSPGEHQVYGIMAQLVELTKSAEAISDPSAVIRWKRQYHEDETVPVLVETWPEEVYSILGWAGGKTIDEIIGVIKGERSTIRLSDDGLDYHITKVEEKCTSEQIVYREGIIGPPLALARHITFFQLAKTTFSRVLESGTHLISPVIQPN